MNWWVPIVFIAFNVLFALGGYFLGKKTQQTNDSLSWINKNKELRALEEESKKRIAAEAKKLEQEKILFDQAQWNEKMKMLSGKKK